MLKTAIANLQNKLRGEPEKRQKLRAFMQASELAALRIIKEHDDAELKAYKKKVADEIEEVHAKY